MTQPDMTKEQAESIAVDEMEPVWRNLWRERCEQIEKEKTELAVAEAGADTV